MFSSAFFKAKAKRPFVVVVFVLAFALVCISLLNRSAQTGRLNLPVGQALPIITLGSTHGLVLAPDGSLWSWGSEDRGFPVLGIGNTTFNPAFLTTLTRIGTETNWVSVSAGDAHNLALRSDGTIWAWGANYRSQLGDGTKTTRSSPVRSIQGNDWVGIVAGSVCSYALKKDGTLWAWGLNNFSQLGINSWVDSPTAAHIGITTNWVKVRAGGVSAGGIQSDGSLWIWGGSPKLGNTAPQNSENFLVPTRFTSDTNWVDLSVAFNIWLAIKSDGTLWAWGRSAHVFTGASESAFDKPTQIGTKADWQACASSGGGFYHVLKKQDGSFWVLDAPDFTPESSRLRRVDLPTDVVAFDAGRGAVAVITRDGEPWAWGAVLGQRTAKDRLLRFLKEQCWRIGWKVQWDDTPTPIIRNQPWQLRNVDPNDR